MRKILLILTLTMCLIMTGCGSTDTNYTKLEGIVTQVHETGIAISTREDGETDYVVTIDEKTKFAEGVSDEFLVGNKVIFEIDVVLESYPMQTTAKKVLYNDDPYKTIGEIVGFTNRGVMILTGDTAEEFEVQEFEDFYLGQTVGIIENENVYELVEYKINNFDTRFTTMGQPILEVSGKIKDKSENSVSITAENGDIDFKTNKAFTIEKGAVVTVDYVEEGEEKTILEIYDESEKQGLTVKDITRTNDGSMVILGENMDTASEMYKVYVTHETAVNFNYSDLAIADTITVYPASEADSAQITASKIIREK